MDLRSDPQQPVTGSIGSLESWHVRGLGPAVDDEGSLVGSRRRPYSYWAECECPGDCTRDHENE